MTSEISGATHRPHPAGHRPAEALAQLASQNRRNQVAVVPGLDERPQQEADDALQPVVVPWLDRLAIHNVHDGRVGQFLAVVQVNH